MGFSLLMDYELPSLFKKYWSSSDCLVSPYISYCFVFSVYVGYYKLTTNFSVVGILAKKLVMHLLCVILYCFSLWYLHLARQPSWTLDIMLWVRPESHTNRL